MNRIVLIQQRESKPAGIARQSQELAEHLKDDLPITTQGLKKFEFRLFGAPRFGYLSLFLSRAVPLRRENGCVYHALDFGIMPLFGEPCDIVNVHDPFPWMHLATYQRTKWEAWMWSTYVPMLLKTPLLVTVSKYVHDLVEGLLDRDSIVIPCGIDTKKWRILGLPKEPRTVLVVGSDYPRKNLIEVVEACGRLERVTLWLAGQWRYPEVKAQVERRAKELGVRYKDLGYVSDRELAYAYNRTTVVCSASKDEGFGLTPVEAMACGTVPIVSDIPPHVETMQQNAVYFDADDVEDIADSLESGLRKGARGPNWDLREHARQYDWSRIVPRYENLYEQVSNGGAL